MNDNHHNQSASAAPFWADPTELASLAGALAETGERLQTTLEAWLERAGQADVNPGSAAEAVLRLFPGLGEQRAAFDDWPVLGLAPAHQRNARAFVRHYLAWQEALPEWQQHMQQAATAALMEFRAACLALPSGTSFAEITEAAAHCLDERHQALLNDDAFLSSHARLEQSRLRLQESAQRLVQPLWQELGLASQDDVLVLRQRQREELDAVRQELAELRATIRPGEHREDD